MFKLTPQRIQSYPRHTHKNHFSVTHLHFFNKTVRDTIIAKSPTRYVISKLSRTSHLKILSKNIFTEPAVNGKTWKFYNRKTLLMQYSLHTRHLKSHPHNHLAHTF